MFVQTGIREWGFVKVTRLISIKLVSIQSFNHCVLLQCLALLVHGMFYIN